jgi:hypothetical protein
LYIIAPGIVMPYLGTVLLTYAASLSFPLFVAGLILLVTLVLRRGGIALVAGIMLYFAMSIVQGLLSFVAYATKSILGLQIISVLSPNVALGTYYGILQSSPLGQPWTPSFTEVLGYVGASYAITVLVFLLGYAYFTRRMNL